MLLALEEQMHAYALPNIMNKLITKTSLKRSIIIHNIIQTSHSLYTLINIYTCIISKENTYA